MRWGRKRQIEASEGVKAGGAQGPAEDALARELEARGVPREVSRPLALSLSERGAALGPDPALVEGAVLAFAVLGSTSKELVRSVRELREVERLMGAFSGELSKLDEVLEVLAAYVRRMRTSTPADEARTLH